MGLIVKEQLSGDCLLGIWEISENFDTLYSGFRLDEEEHENWTALRVKAGNWNG